MKNKQKSRFNILKTIYCHLLVGIFLVVGIEKHDMYENTLVFCLDKVRRFDLFSDVYGDL